MNLLKEERRLWEKGFDIIACLDESGRGPLAGPVIASAVTVEKNSTKKDFEFFRELRDSKKMSSRKREEIFKKIISHPKIEWGIGRVSEKVIDKINILQATKLAMERALKNLEKKLKKRVDFLIIDGNFKINSKVSQKPIVKADEKVFSCVMASIIAKVKRDKLMLKYHKKYPQYGFDKHKGYPTKYHKEVIKKQGACKLHRKTFRGVK